MGSAGFSTQSDLDKMANIWQPTFSNTFSWDLNGIWAVQIPPTFFPVCPIDKEAALVKVVAWCLTGNKPKPEPILAKTHAAIWRH